MSGQTSLRTRTCGTRIILLAVWCGRRIRLETIPSAKPRKILNTSGTTLTVLRRLFLYPNVARRQKCSVGRSGRGASVLQLPPGQAGDCLVAFGQFNGAIRLFLLMVDL